MPVDFGLYSQKSTATSTPSRSMYSSKHCGTRVPSSSYSSRREGEPYWAAHSLQDSFRVGRRAAWTWASINGIPFSKLPAPLDDHRYAMPQPYEHRCEAYLTSGRCTISCAPFDRDWHDLLTKSFLVHGGLLMAC